MTKKIGKTIGLVAAAIILLLIAGAVYRTFFTPAYAGNGNVTGVLLFGLLTGGTIAFLILRLRNIRKTHASIQTNSHTVVESMKKVFKIVVAEGQLNEIFNYENTKKLLHFIPSTKKALVIVRAKVLIGYDVNKCRWEIDEEHREIRLKAFPKPELLSIDTDFNYYYFEDDLFNFIGRKDLQQIQELAKEQVKKAALQSGLMKIAADQMKLLLREVVAVNNWRIGNSELIDDYAYLPEPEVSEAADGEASLLKKSNMLDKALNLLKM